MTGDALLAAELFAVCVETNVEVEGMKAANVAARTTNNAIPFGQEKFLALLARHESRVDRVKQQAKARAAASPSTCKHGRRFGHCAYGCVE